MKKNAFKKGLIIIICLSLIAQIAFNFQNNYTTVYAADTGVVNTTSLNVRTGAGTKYALLKQSGKNVALKKGQKVTINSTKTESGQKWYNISFTYNNKTLKGYVYSPYITMDKTTKSSTTTISFLTKIPAVVANVTNLNVRSAAGTNQAQLVIDNKKVQLKTGTGINVVGEKMVSGEKWYKISFTYNSKTKTGYVLSDYVNLTLKTKIKALVSASSSVKIRTGAGSTKSYLKDANKKDVSLKAKKEITVVKEVIAEGKKWFQISFAYSNKTLTGYILANSINLFEATPMQQTTTQTTAQTTTQTTTQATTKATTEENIEPTTQPTTEPEVITTGKTVTGKVKQVNILGVLSKARYTSSVIEFNGNKVYVEAGHKVEIQKVEMFNDETWYQVKLDYQGSTVTGYIAAVYIELDIESEGTTAEQTTQQQTIPLTTISNEEFEAKLNQEGFPAEYKTALMNLHTKHPYWEFKAINTGLDWNTVIANESKVGVNLITNSKNIAWKSLEKNAYDWSTDKFIPYDGSTWVTASKSAIEYYMDPRNFLNEKSIYQFEALSYQGGYQTQEGVESILKYTPMYRAKYTWTGDTEVISKLYSETFMNAAEYSGVSPYHLATRVKQEVVTGSTSMSSSVSGTVSGYEGLYNFYNIGATHSTVLGGAIANGLNYALNGTSNAITNALYLIPWTTPYKAIVGGAQFIGASYIKRGQNTVYLQKFNVTSTSTYSHQYMSNVEAANAEALKTYAAYSELQEAPIVFCIPLYNNMPSSPKSAPTTVLNPNNWLKTLTIDGYDLYPEFDNKTTQDYSLVVDNTVTEINVNALPVSSTATVLGAGIISLVTGTNEVIITVAAQNGDVKNYTIYITKLE